MWEISVPAEFQLLHGRRGAAVVAFLGTGELRVVEDLDERLAKMALGRRLPRPDTAFQLFWHSS